MKTLTYDWELHQGAAVDELIPVTGLPTTGVGVRCHIRDTLDALAPRLILSHDGPTNRRVTVSAEGIRIQIGATVSGGLVMVQPRNRWVYDVEVYSLTDADDVLKPRAGTVYAYREATRESDTTALPPLASGDGRYLRIDGDQGLTPEQQAWAQHNSGTSPGGPGGASDHGALTGLADDDHPHYLTNARGDARYDAIGAAAAAVGAHAGATDPHGDRSYADGLASNYATAAQGALADSAVQDVAAEIHSATAASIADADEQGFWQSASSALRKITWANIKSTVKTYTDTLYAALGHGHANTDVSGLGGAATLNVGTTAGTVAAGDDARLTDDRTASSLRSATTVVSVSAATAPSSGQVLTATSSTAATWQTPSGGSPGGSSGQIPYNNAGTADGSPLWREDANTVTQRNGTSAQAGRWANTWTDGSNYELGRVQWVSNVLTIGTLNAGTGSARAVAIQAGGVTAISIDTSAIVSIGALNITGWYGLAGNGSNPLFNFRHYQASTTLTSYTLPAGDSGVFYIATSGSDQTLTMPASPSAGTWYGFKVSASKSSYLRFTANTGQKIRLSGGLSASAGYVRSNTGGSFVYLMYDSTDAEWVAWQQGGTWTIDS